MAGQINDLTGTVDNIRLTVFQSADRGKYVNYEWKDDGIAVDLEMCVSTGDKLCYYYRYKSLTNTKLTRNPV